MALIHGRQQADILQRVLAGKPGYRALPAPELTSLAVLGYQSGDLLTGITTDFHQIADQDTFVRFPQPWIAKFVQDALDPAVAIILITDDGEGHCLCSGKEFCQLINCL